MQPLTQMSPAEASAIQGVFFDLDDTFLDEGRLSAAAYESLHALSGAGVRMVALTGRPAAWAELVARMWPIEAAIAENGPVGFTRQGARVVSFDTVTAAERASRAARLSQLVEQAKQQIPALVSADDVAGRLTDYTFDIGEHERATEETIAQARTLAHAAGAKTTRSSVHLHFTFDRSDKACGALSYLAARGTDVTAALKRFAFIGDSENDAPCFNAFASTVGVANLRGDFSLRPRYRTEGRASEGFCEFAQTLLRLRGAT